MWVAEACFDGASEPFKKALLPGNEYQFGRKEPADLILADKTVSKESAILHVGHFQPSSEEALAPILKVQALKKPLRLIPERNEADWIRDQENFIGETIKAEDERELQSGDILILTKSAPSVKLTWQPIVFGALLKVPKEEVESRREACHLFGIRIERSKQFTIQPTHLITPSGAALTTPIMNALAMATPFVSLAFIDEIIKRAQYARDDDASIQKKYVLPKCENFFPENIEIEAFTQREIRTALAPNPIRRTIFTGTTVLHIYGEAGSGKQADQLLPICRSSGARIIHSDVSQMQDEQSLLRLLRRNKSEAETLLAECGEAASEAPDDGLVVICDPDHSNHTWYGTLVRLTKQLNIAMPSTGAIAISKAILHADARRFLNCPFEDPNTVSIRVEDTQLTTIPPTIPETRQQEEIVKLSAPSASDELQPTHTMQSPPKPPTATDASTTLPASNAHLTSPKKPKRRAAMARGVLDDIFGVETSDALIQPDSEATIPATAQENDQTQRSTARPRRYQDGDSKRPRISEAYRSLFGDDAIDKDSQMTNGDNGLTSSTALPRTRKYREQLDEADRLESQRESQSQMEQNGEVVESQIDARRTDQSRKRRAASPLPGEFQASVQRQRREATAESEIESFERQADDGMVDVDEEISSTIKPRTEIASAQPAVVVTQALANAVMKEKPAKSNAQNGTDTDDKFLQAMATSKKSRKGLDQFDKEFNMLKIAKPDHRTGNHGRIIADADDPEYRAWEQMGASDFDINAAGNFVQVDFVPLIYQRTEEEEIARKETLLRRQKEWNGKPNFKKFKVKQKQNRKPVMMDIEEGMDYGLGDGYIRKIKAKSRRQDDNGDEEEEDELQSLGSTVLEPESIKMTRNDDNGGYSDEENRASLASTRRSATLQASSHRTQSRKASQENQETKEEGNGNTRRIDMRLTVDEDMDDSIFRPKRQANSTISKKQSSTLSGSKRTSIDLSSDDDDDEDVSNTFSGFKKKRKV